MAKYLQKIKARKLRSKGESVGMIAKKIGVTKSTVSLWVRDIILSIEQLEELNKRKIKGGELGRLKGSLMQKNRRLNLIKQRETEGRDRLKNLSDKELFVAGIALYWAEGSKKKREFFICNSDPEMIVFMIGWIEKFFGIKRDRLKVVVGINEIHRSREGVVKNYWSNITGIPLTQFRKTSFKKVKSHKIYANFNEHYGTLGVTVLKGSDIYYKMLGLIEGLSEARHNFISQGSSVGRAQDS